MNEDTQLALLEAELAAQGWKVERDVRPEFMDLPNNITLDFVGIWPDESDSSYRPPRHWPTERCIIIEVANRNRAGWDPIPDPKIGCLPLPTANDEEQAVGRFQAISEAVAKLGFQARRRVHLEVRMLDVSAEQQAARRVTSTRYLCNKNLLEEVGRSKELLDKHKPADDSPDLRTHCLWVAHLWSRWLRIMAHRFPGRDRKELPWEDLRMIQKDLFDHNVIKMPPAEYQQVHQSVIATMEGGEVSWSQLSELEPDLRRVLARVEENLTAKTEKEATGSSPSRISLAYQALEGLIRQRAPEDRKPLLLEALRNLQSSEGTPRFRDALLTFSIEISEVKGVTQHLRSLERLVRD